MHTDLHLQCHLWTKQWVVFARNNFVPELVVWTLAGLFVVMTFWEGTISSLLSYAYTACILTGVYCYTLYVAHTDATACYCTWSIMHADGAVQHCSWYVTHTDGTASPQSMLSVLGLSEGSRMYGSPCSESAIETFWHFHHYQVVIVSVPVKTMIFVNCFGP